MIDKIGIKAIKTIHNQICSEGNLFFYITGCFDIDDLVLLRQYIESYHLSKSEIRQNIAPVPGMFFKRNGQIELKNNHYHYIRFSFDIDTTKYTYAELDLLYDMLFSGDNSKIYLELSENTGFIYSYDARLERYNNIGNMYFSFEISKKNILPAIQKVIGALNGAKTNITEELAYITPFYIDNAEFDLDDAEGLNWNMAYECHIMQNTYKSIDEKKKEYQIVTPKRMMKIAKDIFTQNNMLVTIKTDKKKFDLEGAYEITEKL